MWLTDSFTYTAFTEKQKNTPFTHDLSGFSSMSYVQYFSGKVGIPYVAAYSATKFALNGFFSSLRNEFLVEGTPPVSITLCTIGLVGQLIFVSVTLYCGSVDRSLYQSVLWVS